MINKNRVLHLAFLAAATVSLVGCGGGSSSANEGASTPPTTSSTPSTPTTLVATSGTLQATAPVADYAASSVQGSMYAKLNAVRLAAGAGVLVESAQLNTAAQDHANYLHLYPADGHNETVGNTDFTGAIPANRIQAAGFAAATTSETIGGTGASLQGADCARGLLAELYHAAALLGQYTYVGMGSNFDGLGVPTCVTDLATTSGTSYVQVPASGALVIYPYPGQTDAVETFYVSAESPRAPTSVLPQATAGTPVLVSIRNADYVNMQAAGTLGATVSQFELRDSSGNLVPSVILASASISGASGVTLDNTDGNLVDGWVVLVPQNPLPKGATFSVAFSGTLKAGGTALAKQWSFTTNQ